MVSFPAGTWVTFGGQVTDQVGHIPRTACLSPGLGLHQRWSGAVLENPQGFSPDLHAASCPFVVAGCRGPPDSGLRERRQPVRHSGGVQRREVSLPRPYKESGGRGYANQNKHVCVCVCVGVKWSWGRSSRRRAGGTFVLLQGRLPVVFVSFLLVFSCRRSSLVITTKLFWGGKYVHVSSPRPRLL